MHNYKEVLDSNLTLGDMAIIHKAGDIIPEVKQIIKL
jgi:NAD-dependent DNA ligase